MKKNFIKRHSVLLCSAIALILALSSIGMSLSVHADETSSSDTTTTTSESVVKAINLDNSIKAGDVFYFGTYTANNVEYAVPWVAMNDEGYVFSRYTLGKSVFSSDTTKNLYYPDSQLKTVMDGFYDGDNTLFTDSERNIIKSTTLTAESMDMGSSKTTDTDAYVFPLSGWSIYTFSTNTRTYHGDCNTIKTVAAVNTYRSPTDITNPTGEEVPWWTRTKDKSTSYSKRDSDGNAIAYINYVNTAWWAGTPVSSRAPSTTGIYVRPALTLDTSSVLFRSAPSGKTLSTIGEHSLQKVEAYNGDGTDWKLTFLDSSRSNFTANITKSNGGKVVLGKYATIEYSGAVTGDNEYISAMILSTDGELLYYGQVAKSQESGTAQVYLPKDIEAGNYTLRIFNEQLNDDYKSDFSSAFVDISITAFEDTTAPTGWVSVYHNGNDDHSGFYSGFTGHISETFDREPDDYCNSAVVEIGAKDDSGCDVIIEYFVTNKSYTRDELETVEFLPYTEPLEFGSEYDGKDIAIYGKLTDTSGNVSYINYLWYISIDVTYPVISGIENGKTYCGKQTVTVTDDNLYGVLLNGTNQMNSTDDFCKPFTLEINPASGEQKLMTYDLAMNYTTYTFTINDGHTPEEDDGDCTTPVYCLVCGEIVKEAYDSHDYVYDDEESSALDGGSAYVCSHTDCKAIKKEFNISALKGENEGKDENITITTATGNNKAKEGEIVTLNYLEGYNVNWQVESVLSDSITVTPDDTDSSKATFVMPGLGVVVYASATLKQYDVVYNYIDSDGNPVTEYKKLNYGDNFILDTALTAKENDITYEFCCWQVLYPGTVYTLETFEQTNTSGGKDTMFTANFAVDSITYTIQPHYVFRIEPSFVLTEPFSEENPSFLIGNDYINVQSADVKWYIGKYDDSVDFPSNQNSLLGMGESQTFYEGQTYTVFFWVSLHNEYVSVKKTTEGGSLGYINPIINGVESKWLYIENDYILTYYTFTAKHVRTNLKIVSGANFTDEDGNEISGESTSSYTSIKASIGDKLYLVLTKNPNEGYEFDAWKVDMGDVEVKQDDKGYYIIVNENETIISPTFKKIQYTVKVDILGNVTEQTVEHGSIFNLVTKESLDDGRVFYCWLVENANEKYVWSWYYDEYINITSNCVITACYGLPITPEYYIPTPVVGETPSFIVHDKYEVTLCEEDVFELPFSTYASWYYYSEEDSTYYEMKSSDTFKSNTEYKLYIWLNFTTSGYAFVCDDSGNFVFPLLNGKDMDYEEAKNGYEEYSYTFFSPSDENYEIIVTNGSAFVNTFAASSGVENDSVKVIANDAEIGKVFEKWVITGIDTTEINLTNTEITFKMPTNAVTVAASYKNIDYTITVVDGTASKNIANYGDSVTVIANEAEIGKVFEKWVITGIDTTEINLTNTEITFKMPANAVTVAASYKNIDYTITVVDGTASKNIANYGDSVTIIANEAEDGKEFKCWQDVSGNIVSEDPIYTFTVSSSISLTALYEEKVSTPIKPTDEKDGLSGGAIAGIAFGSTAGVGIGGFSLFWFVIKKKKFSDLIAIFKK